MAVGDKLEITEINGVKVQTVIGGENRCDHCCFNESQRCHTIICMASERTDGNSVYFIKLKEEPVVKTNTIKDIRTKVHTLQGEIYKLVEAFEASTGVVVHGISLKHSQEIANARTTYGIDLDVRLN